MRRIKWTLGREAMLFDSPLYILKAFSGVLTAYVLFKDHPIVGRDMISVLFGMMLTLEPVNRSGCKIAFEQIEASAMGGLVTAVLVAAFGVNLVTVPLSVALTLYLALTINWRAVSPVAFFTAIYMTQYLQVGANGAPSMPLTFGVRMFALLAGIAVALFYNYTFSIFFYKGMLKKRMTYVTETLDAIMSRHSALDGVDAYHEQKADLVAILGDIDAFEALLKDMAHQKRKAERVKDYLIRIDNIRDLAHYYLGEIMEKTARPEVRQCKGDVSAIKTMMTQYEVDRRP